MIDRLERRVPFSFAKINHGFWEHLVRIEDLRARGLSDPRELDLLSGGAPFVIETGFLEELAAALARIPSLRGEFLFGAGPDAWPSCRRIRGTPVGLLGPVLSTIESFVPAQANTADPLLWKRAVYDGSIVGVLKALRDRSVVLIGPSWLTHFGIFADCGDFRHVEIHATRARETRDQLFDLLARTHDPLRDPVYLVSAGALSALLIIRLHEVLHRATFLDMGVVLDLCHIPTLIRRAWALVRRADVARAIEVVNPSWPDDPRAYLSGTELDERRAVWRQFKTGTKATLPHSHAVPPRLSAAGDLDLPNLKAAYVHFVEQKRPDWGRIADISRLSEDVNRWANFGPVARALERAIAATLKLPEGRVVVAASSATAALGALAGLHAVRRGRPLRWVVSAFGFFSTAIGALASHVQVVDCNQQGLLDLSLVDTLDPASWDGLIVTNTFGMRKRLSEYRDYCRARGKSLIIDSALALLGPKRSSVDLPDEVISFHHTKPWGFGEGGCALVSCEDADVVRSFLNFGVGTNPAFAAFSMNGKLSDMAAAAILERLERLPSWSYFYRMQRRRITALVHQVGLELLGDPPSNAIVGHLPVLAPRPKALSQAQSPYFEVRRYYRPLASNGVIAQGIFERIVNVPCHPGMAAVPTVEIERFLTQIRN